MPKRAIILTANGFQDEEVVYPFYRLQEAGVEAVIATTHLQARTEKGATYDLRKVGAIPLDEKILEQDWDAVIVPGGFEAPDRVRCEQAALDLVERMDRNSRLVAAICHGPWVLISAGIMRYRTATGYKSIRHDLENAGAVYEEAPVVVDGNLITSAHYKHLPEFMREVCWWLAR